MNRIGQAKAILCLRTGRGCGRIVRGVSPDLRNPKVHTAPEPEATPESPCATNPCAASWISARQLAQEAKEKFAALRQLPAGVRLGESEVCSGKETLAGFVDRVVHRSKNILQELAKIREAAQVPTDAITEIDAAETAGQSLASEPGRFLKRLSKLDLTVASTAAPTPSAQAPGVDSLRTALASLGSTHRSHLRRGANEL